ncbi:MAG: class I mannose-6-phosphate isomerase [Eubacteriales bacterium]|nr:class I mannose-6-phosphate isomerase [Eubacteriales bacterium]
MNKAIYSNPVQLSAKYAGYLWGGDLLRRVMGKSNGPQDLGESWEASALPAGQSTVCLPGGETVPFGEYAVGQDFYGAETRQDFPLLIKLIGACKPLSVQVHPSDESAQPGERGKTEAWYVLHAQPGARMVYGVDCGAQEFARAVREGTLRDVLHWVDVKPGDVLYVRPGQIHAIGEGIAVYEVQQTSDTTFRVYDWDRVDEKTGKGRPLHVQRALEVCDASLPNVVAPGAVLAQENGEKTVYLHVPCFTLERIRVAGDYTDDFFGGFALYTVIDGMTFVGADEPLLLKKGDSFVAPAAAGAVRLCGIATLLKSFLPPQEAYAQWLTRMGCCTAADGTVTRAQER